MNDETERKCELLREQLEIAWTPERASRVEGRVRRIRRRRRTIARIGTAAVGIACVAILVVALRSVHSSRMPEIAKVQPAPEGARVETLQDGSRVELGPNAALIRHVDSRNRVHVELGSGGARFDVTHDPTRPFRVEAGPVAVEVIGTRFEVVRGSAQTFVSVIEGHVAVSWSGGRADLLAGQNGAFPPEDRGTPAVPSHAATVAPPRTRREAKPSASATSRLAEWHEPELKLPVASMLGDAATPSCDQASALLATADAARQKRHPEEAVEPLRRLLRDHRKDPSAPLAAFTLGRVLEDLGRPAEAADAFSQAQGPGSPLAEDALAREVEAAARAGDHARAGARARLYLQRYPTGTRQHEVRRYGELE